MDSKTTVAILNWNGLAHLKQYLPSVLAHSGAARIRVIDNASTDASVAWLKETHPEVEIQVLESNLGFTGGYNEALKSIETEYTVLLNSDVEVSPGWLGHLEKRMDSNPNIAACQPKILSWAHQDTFEYAGACGGFLDKLGYPFCRGRMFETCETDQGQYDQAIPVFWASGACLMVRTKTFLENNGFETRFFAHMEEIDLCWRLWERGHTIWVEPASTVFHLGAGTLLKTSPRKTFLNYRNGMAMLFMNSSFSELFWKIPLRLVLDGIASLRYARNGEFYNLVAIAKAHLAFYKEAGFWNQRRKENQKLRKGTPPPSVYMQKSILPSYFLLGKKKFSQLEF